MEEEFEQKKGIRRNHYTQSDIDLFHGLFDDLAKIGLKNYDLHDFLCNTHKMPKELVDLKCKYFMLSDGYLCEEIAFYFSRMNPSEYLCKKIIEISKYYTKEVASKKSFQLENSYLETKSNIYQALSNCATQKHAKEIYELALMETDYRLLCCLSSSLMKLGYKEQIINEMVNDTKFNPFYHLYFLNFCAKVRQNPKLYELIKKIEQTRTEELESLYSEDKDTVLEIRRKTRNILTVKYKAFEEKGIKN